MFHSGDPRPTSKQLGVRHYVRGNKKARRSSLMHMSIPTLLRNLEKKASTLHLYQLGDGLLHLETSRGLTTEFRQF